MKNFTRTSKIILLTVFVFFTTSLTSSTYADPPPGKGYNKNQGKKNKKDKKDLGDRDEHGQTLRRSGITYASARAMALDYRYVGYPSLPPGIQKNLARGKPLPPGIAKKRVPGKMMGRLPAYAGYEWVVAGDSLALIYSHNGVVADVFLGVFK